MLGTRSLEEMSEDEVLDAAESCAETVRRAEVELLRVAYQWAVLHSADRLDPAESGLPGRERARQLGGPGTAEVTEFAAGQLGIRIGRSPHAARALIADALDLVHRHPQLWARVQAGEVRASYARHVVGRTRDLQPEEAAYVDAGVAESADGRISWSRFEALVTAKVAQAAPALAREKEERARTATFAKRLRGEGHGMASFLIRADAATITAIDAAVTAKATELAALRDQRPEDERDPDLATDDLATDDLATDDLRRVRSVLLLATGATADTEVSDLLPGVHLYAHVYAGPDREEIVRVEGHGPVTEEWVRDVLGPRARFTIQPVLDLAGQAPVDAYEIPDRHRRAVRLMTPADTFPHASCTSRSMQVDHTIPYHQGGTSGLGNYGPMTTTHHRTKTHGGFQVKQPFPGIYLWRDPSGRYYLVDHTGTRPLRPHHTTTHVEQRRPAIVVELWHRDLQIDHAAAS